MSNPPPAGFRPETLAVGFGYDPDTASGAAKPPIYMTSTFVYASAQNAKDVHEAFFHGTGPLAGKGQHIYARLGHPGLDILEARLAAIDGAEAAVSFSSGMAAHSSIALTFVRPGDSVVYGRPIYGGVDHLYDAVMPLYGAHAATYTDGTDEADVRAAIEPLRVLRTTWGNHLDPYTAWLLLRSLESVHVRVERAMDNAFKVATFLRDHPKVAGITYLGFLPEGSRQREVYDRQCKAAGSTFSFHLHGGEAEAFRMLDRLRLLKLAVSLGGSETLICHSASTTHYAVAPEDRRAGGITDGTIRLSVGIEHVDDLIADLSQALDAV